MNTRIDFYWTLNSKRQIIEIMMSKKLTIIFLTSLLLIYTHGLEEILTGFQHTDSFMILGASLFNTTPDTFYWISHIIWWMSVPILFILLKNTSLILYLMGLFGLVFFIEIHHLFKALFANSYYPGMFTALLYPVAGFFYWKQLIHDWRKQK